MTKADLPTGTVTFLFTDIEGSTELWDRHPEAMKAALARHDDLLSQAVESNGGRIVKTTGDGVHAVFATAADAVRAGIEVQEHSESLETAEFSLAIRMGLHTGEAELRAGDYFGQALNRAARIMSAAHGGQVLVSEVTAQVVREHLAPGMELRDLGGHHLKGLVREEHIYQVVAPGLRTDFPALHSLAAATNNLPVQLTSFIGRDNELAEAHERLAGTRLLTLIGPGGIGKTRLAIQIAAEQLARFKDGAWLVELASVTDPALLLSTIASVFEVREIQGTRLSDLLIDYLRGRELLLVLDNCEHLIEASAQAAQQLLHACPALTILASSREALGVDGETVYRIPSLALPEPETQSLMDYAAAQLFVERATRAEPRFHAGPEHAAAIVQICRRLDGIPLAIELAAARVKVFTPAQIADRLDDRFKLLTGGSRTALPRQQTLQALIDWSYLTLTDIEQRALRRLAVFSGGWSFEAAEAVLGQAEALEGLPGVVHKSMVNVDEQGGAARYGFLETIRQYAMEKLVESGEASETRDRHLDYFLKLAERHYRGWESIGGVEVLDLFETEHDNVRAALDWATSNQLARAARLAQAMAVFWTARDYNYEAREWCRHIIRKTEAAPGSEADRAKLLALAAWSSMTMGEPREARAEAEEALALAANGNDTATIARAYANLALACIFLGDFPAAQQAALEGEKTARKHRHMGELTMVLAARAQLAFYLEQDLEQARQLMNEFAQIGRELGFGWASSMALFGLARTAAAVGDLEAAREGFRESAAIARQMGNKRIVHSSASELAHVLRENGEVDEPLAMYRDLLPKWRDLGHRPAIAHELECIAYLLTRKELPERAAPILAAAQAIRDAIGSTRTTREEAEYQQEISNLRAGMDAASLELLWKRGLAMDMDQAIAFALEPAPTDAG